MIARHDGRITLVSGAIPGERVRAVIERRRRDVLLARTIDVLEPSDDRRRPDADPSCAGRSFAHITPTRQRTLKAEIVVDAFRRIGRMELDERPVVAGSPERGYRLRARLHVAGGRVGFLEEGSHRVCPVAGTGQLLPATERVVEALDDGAELLTAAGVSTLELAEDLSGSQRVVHAVGAGDLGTVASRLAPLAEIAGVTGCSVGSSGAPGPPRVVAGDVRIVDPLEAFLPVVGAGVFSLARHASAFFQSNRYLVPELVAAVAQLAAGERVVDLYAGVGLFALSLAAAHGGTLTAVERDPTSAGDLHRNAEPLAPTVEVVTAPVETYLKRVSSLSEAVVIVDPPRIGLTREVTSRLAGHAPARIVYVSCDVATQARDLRRLAETGYRLDQLRVLDMFPNTPHIETVALLVRE